MVEKVHLYANNSDYENGMLLVVIIALLFWKIGILIQLVPEEILCPYGDQNRQFSNFQKMKIGWDPRGVQLKGNTNLEVLYWFWASKSIIFGIKNKNPFSTMLESDPAATQDESSMDLWWNLKLKRQNCLRKRTRTDKSE